MPLAIVSDMGKGIATAVTEVFKNIPAFICHYHFLKSVGKNLFGDENDIIRKRSRKHNVRVVLRRTRDRLEKIIIRTTSLESTVMKGIEQNQLPVECSLAAVPIVATYTLISWILDANAESNGFGFPFDQSYLVFYKRLHEACQRLHQLYKIQFQGEWKENKVYSKISHDLFGVMNDNKLQEAALNMEEKVEVFNRLRKAMRITFPENKRGLSDNGDLPTNMKTIKIEVNKFKAWLSKRPGFSEHKKYQKLVEQLNIYGEKLFVDPIIAMTAAGKMIIQPQRTNNILEQFFRKLMRGYRKKNGFNSVDRIFIVALCLLHGIGPRYMVVGSCCGYVDNSPHVDIGKRYYKELTTYPQQLIYLLYGRF